MLCYAWDFPKTTSFRSILGWYQSQSVSQSVSLPCTQLERNVFISTIGLPASRVGQQGQQLRYHHVLGKTTFKKTLNGFGGLSQSSSSSSSSSCLVLTLQSLFQGLQEQRQKKMNLFLNSNYMSNFRLLSPLVCPFIRFFFCCSPSNLLFVHLGMYICFSLFRQCPWPE